jgi:pimeloyl-ACP methyl ester carboxylesterase
VYLDINGARIHVEREGSGFPLILLHEGVADIRMWEPQLEAFTKHFEVIRPEQRGFGQSELPAQRWSPVADLLAIMDALALKPAHMVGGSMGAGLAIDFALDHPERVSKLVLIGPAINGLHLGAKYADLWTDADAAEKAHDVDALNRAEMQLFLGGPTRSLSHIDQRLQDLFLDMNGIALRNDADSAPHDEIDPPAAGRLGEITAPTLVVVGDSDIPPVFDAVDVVMRDVKGARKAVIRDAAHLPNLEHPDEFNRLVLDFLLS